MFSFLQMQLPFSSHIGIGAVMLNISGLSLAIKRGQVFVIEKIAVTRRTYWLLWTPKHPVLCCAGNLTFPHCLHLPSCLRRCTQWCRTKFCKQGQKRWVIESTGTLNSVLPSLWNLLTNTNQKALSANRVIPGAKCTAGTAGNLKNQQNCRRYEDKVVFSLSHWNKASTTSSVFRFLNIWFYVWDSSRGKKIIKREEVKGEQNSFSKNKY